MSGTGAAEIRHAYVPESTPATIPSTPSFITFPGVINAEAKPNIVLDKPASAGFRIMNMGRSGQVITADVTAQLRYGVMDAFLETLLQGTWTSNVLKDSVTGRKTIAIEQTVPAGQGGTATYLRFRGLEGVSGKIMAKAEGESTFEMKLMGVGADDATTTAISGATYTTPTNSALFGSGAELGSISVGSFTLPCFEELSVEFEMENKEGQPRIMSDDYCGIDRGSLMAKITANAYIESGFAAIYNAAISGGSDFATTLTLGTVTTNKYTLEFPRCQVIGAPIDTSGKRPFQKLEIQALYDTSSSAVTTITRAVA